MSNVAPPPALHLTGDAAADRVLGEDPFALLLGMLLDQQYPMEHAFRGPAQESSAGVGLRFASE